VGDWRETFAEIDATAEPMTPTSGLWARIERNIAAVVEGETSPKPWALAGWFGGLWRNLDFWRGAGLIGAAAALLFAVFTGTVMLRQPTPIAVAVLTDDATPGAPPGALVEAFADGSIRLVPLRDIPVPEGRTLQVWTLWDRARGPVSLGTMPRAQNARFSVAGLPQPRAEQLYEITLEPAGGSPLGRPTGPILYKGTATLIR
jgi:anti-sigma-K factor RskA